MLNKVGRARSPQSVDRKAVCNQVAGAGTPDLAQSYNANAECHELLLWSYLLILANSFLAVYIASAATSTKGRWRPISEMISMPKGPS